MQVVVDGIMSEYNRVGKGQSIVLLHGWGDSLATFKELQISLSKHYDVIALDLPGFGKTATPPKVWGLSDYALFVSVFLRKIDVKPYAIVGHSNGGAIAIYGIGNGVLQSNKLVLLASAGIRGQYNGRNKALRLVTKTGKLLTSPLPKSMKKRLRSKVYQTVGSDMLVAEHLQETFKKIVTEDVRGCAANIHIPTLLVYGDKDVSTPPQFGTLLHESIRGSHLVRLPEAEHFVHLDEPDKVLHLVEEFLA